MVKNFWKKLKKNQRSFKWFFDNYISGENSINLAYNTLYQQAKGDLLRLTSNELKSAMMAYLNDGEK